MGLHVRTIMPYALPGVLALLACWWFFSRKKDGRSKKHDHISACAGKLQTDDALEELLREEVPSNSRAQVVQLDRVEETALHGDVSCASLLGVSETSMYEMQTCIKAENCLEELYAQSEILDTLQGSPNQQVFKCNSAKSLRENEVGEVEDDGNCCTSSVIHFTSETIKAVTCNSDAVSKDLENACLASRDPPCGCNQASEIQSFLTKTNRHSSDIQDHLMPEICTQTEALEKNVPRKEQEVKSHAHKLEAMSAEVELTSKEAEMCSQPSELTVSPCHCEQSKPCNEGSDLAPTIPCFQCEEEDHAQTESRVIFVKKLDARHSIDDLQVADTRTHQPPCFQSVTDEMGLLLKGDVKLQSSEHILFEQPSVDNLLSLNPQMTPAEVKGVSSPCTDHRTADETPECCVKSSITEVASESNCTDLLDAFSKCLGKNEQLSSSGLVVDSLTEENAKAYLGDYEAKIVEQLAINIISKVIVAATQEILSSSVSDKSESPFQVLDENGYTLEKEAVCNQLVPLKEDYGSVSANLTVGLIDFDCTCESTLTEPSQTEDPSSTEMIDSKSFLEQKSDDELKAPDESFHQLSCMSDFSPVHRRATFLEESQAGLEDSSLSVCTSEEGINVEDPLQSTVLSSGGVCSYHSLSSSGIDLSSETFVSSDNTKAAGSRNVLYSNGDIKRGSPDLNSEGPLTAESDHSGGSDVNSMDSVDSGCALGNGEQYQNVKQKTEVKKADLIVWEFEVPKYLVGRLIGKQGRFVSFLKQSSGAKIYISTVPYTQDIQICHLEGSQLQIDKALSLIRKKFKDLNLTNIFAPPPPLIPLPVASWLTLPSNVSVEVVVVTVVNAGHMFVQQRTHPTFHALCGLDQHMSLCYSQPGIPTLPTPAEVGILCAAPVGPNVWWRAQVMAYYEDTEEVEILFVDYGGYNRVKIETLRQIRSDFVSLPFQGVEVLLDNVVPLGDEDQFSAEADAAVKELTRGAPMLTQVTNYDEATRLPLVQLWRLNPDEMVSVNRTLVERGFAEWIDSY